MPAELLSAITASILSLIVSFVPGFSDWFATLDGALKRLLMFVLLLLVSVGIFALCCAGLGDDLNISYTCDRSGFVSLLRIFWAALASNQATFLLSKRNG